MKSRSPPAEISSAALEKIRSPKGRLLSTRVSFTWSPKRAPVRHAGVPVCLLQLEFVRKRHHKDILSSPVLMLNFCPNLLCEPSELHKATRELLFLVDRSGSMSGTKIQSVKVRHGVCFWDINRAVSVIPPCVYRKPW